MSPWRLRLCACLLALSAWTACGDPSDPAAEPAPDADLDAGPEPDAEPAPDADLDDADPDAEPAPDAELDAEPDAAPDEGPQNVLIVIADDLGLDSSACYGATGVLADTPHIRALCETGVVFNHAWVTPTCSPTRATLLTGRYPLRHGVGAPVGMGNPSLGMDEVTIPRVLDMRPALNVAHANIGKWHLTAGQGANLAPNDFGWSHYAGIINGTVQDYFDWTKTTNGQESSVQTYATTELVDDAIAWIGDQEQQERPWLLWLAFNAPHTPFHAPPPALHRQELGESQGECPRGQNAACYRAAIEAMDTELGRLLGSLSPGTRARTHIIYLGDNGTPPQVAQAPVTAERSKDSLYEGGVRVPFIVSGPAVVDGGRAVDAIIDASDVFATALEMAGVDPSEVALLAGDRTIDSVSVVPYLQDPAQPPLRAWAWTELHASQAGPERPGRAIRDARFKLIAFADGREELYDLDADPWELTELIAAGLSPEGQDAYDALKARLEALVASP